MNRHTALTRYIEDWRGRDFTFGANDCALFIAGWLEHCTGSPLKAQFKGRYTTHEEGLKLLAEAGHTDLEAACEAFLTPVPSWTVAQTGDVGWFRERVALGLVAGGFVHVLSIRRGVDVLPLDQVDRVFRP